jgi:recombinational DNA repair protein RecT
MTRRQLECHAHIVTVGELATFHINYRGMYTLLKETRVIPQLDHMIQEAEQIVKKYREMTSQLKQSSERSNIENSNNSPSTLYFSLSSSSLSSSIDCEMNSIHP